MYAKTMKIRLMATVAAVATLCGCGEAEPVKVIRLDKAFAEYATDGPEARLELAEEYAPEFTAFFQLMSEPFDSASLVAYSESRAVKVFQPDVDRMYPNVDALEQQIGGMVAAAQKNDVKLGVSTYCTVVWGFNQSIVKNDSIVFIALNQFLGSEYPGYSHIDYYLRREKIPEMIPYKLAEALVAMEYPFDFIQQPTLLSRMLYEGAMVEAVMRIVPHASLGMALGYDDEQLELAEDNMQKIWNEMSVAKHVYSIDYSLIERLTSPAPSSPYLEGKAPGRIGRFIGYQIVKAYLKKHSDTTLTQLLSPKFYTDPQSLIDSGF